jgi:hypothetical protein
MAKRYTVEVVIEHEEEMRVGWLSALTGEKVDETCLKLHRRKGEMYYVYGREAVKAYKADPRYVVHA